MEIAQIIPILPVRPDDQDIDKLITYRQDRSSVAAQQEGRSFLDLSATQLRAEARSLYQYAVSQKILLEINLVIKQLGTRDSTTNQYQWEHEVNGMPLQAFYDCEHATTFITVNKLVVLSNTRAGHEALFPGAGNWLRLFRERFRQIESERGWREDLLERQEREDLILKFQAPV
jgi:hypothetical protein